MASILGTGTMWIKVPETIKVVIDGELPENVMSKDIILRLIGDLRADGATYRALEFAGSTIESFYGRQIHNGKHGNRSRSKMRTFHTG